MSVDYEKRSVSLKLLEEVRQRLNEGLEAKDIVLKTVKKEHNGLAVGTTVLVKNAFTTDGHVPGKGSVKINPLHVLPKPREKWTLQDVYLYVLAPGKLSQAPLHE